MIRLVLTLVIACCLTGCGLTTRQAQNLADGLAGIEAIEPRVVHDQTASTILAGAHDHIEAVAVEARTTLPPPTRSPAAIAADAGGYAENARASIDAAHTSAPWWGWCAGIGAAIFGFLRIVPGSGGVVADMAWRLLAPTATKIQDQRREVHAQGFQELVGLIEQLRNDQTIAHLKAKVTTATSSAVRDDIRRLTRPNAMLGLVPTPAPSR